MGRGLEKISIHNKSFQAAIWQLHLTLVGTERVCYEQTLRPELLYLLKQEFLAWLRVAVSKVKDFIVDLEMCSSQRYLTATSDEDTALDHLTSLRDGMSEAIAVGG